MNRPPEVDYTKPFSEILKTARVAKGYPTANLLGRAMRLNSPQLVGMIEDKNGMPKPENLYRLGAFLGLDLRKLFAAAKRDRKFKGSYPKKLEQKFDEYIQNACDWGVAMGDPSPSEPVAKMVKAIMPICDEHGIYLPEAVDDLARLLGTLRARAGAVSDVQMTEIMKSAADSVLTVR